MATPATPGSGFTFRKKTFATPRRGVKGGNTRTEKENDEAASGAVTNTEFVRRSRRVLSTSDASAGVTASDAMAAAAAAVAEEDLVELEFHRKSRKSPNGLTRRSSTDGCAHERTPTRGEIARIARANGATTEEEIERAISESENEYEAKRQQRRAAEKAEEARLAADIAKRQEIERSTRSAIDAEGGFDDSMPDHAFAHEQEVHVQQPQPQQQQPQQQRQQAVQESQTTKREAGIKRKPSSSKRRAAKLVRTLSSDSKISGVDLAARLQPTLTSFVTELTAKDGARHPAVVDCIHDICDDFARNVEREAYFRRTNMAVNPRNDDLRNKERSLRILLGRLDAEASQWKALRAEFDALPALNEMPFDDGQDMPAIVMPQSFNPNPLLESAVLNVDQILPAVKRADLQERQAAEYIASVAHAVTREGFSAFGAQEDARDIIKQIIHE